MFLVKRKKIGQLMCMSVRESLMRDEKERNVKIAKRF